MGRFRGAAALGAACAFFMLPLEAAAEAAPATNVPRTDQAERDSERLRILRDELAREQARAADAVKRHAERLAAGDRQGAEEAERTRHRSASGIAALRREIAAATQAQATPRAPAPPTEKRVKPPEHGTRWWDVYANRRPDNDFQQTRQPSAMNASPAARQQTLTPGEPR